MRTKKAIIHGRHSRKRNGRNIGNNYSNKRNSTPIKKRSIKNKVGGASAAAALLGISQRTNCETSYKRFVNDKCFSLALTKQLDLAISEFLVELSQPTIRTKEYYDEKEKIYLFDTESRMLYNKIRERMFPFLLGIMKMRKDGELLGLADFDGPYNFLISTIILSHIEERHVVSFVKGKVVSFYDLSKEIEKTGKKTDDCFKSNKCIEINPVIRTHILFPYLIVGYNSVLFGALNVLRHKPTKGGSRVLVGGAEVEAARAEAEAEAARAAAGAAEAARAAAEAAEAAAAAAAEARAGAGEGAAAAPEPEAAREGAEAAAGAAAGAAGAAAAAREGAEAAAAAKAEASKAEAGAPAGATAGAPAGAPAGAEAGAAAPEAAKAEAEAAAEAARNLKRINDKFSKIIRLLQIAGIEDKKYTTLLDKILSKLGVNDAIMTPYVLNQELPFFGDRNSLSVFKICNQIFQIFIELETKNSVLNLDSFAPKELSHLEHLLCTGEMEDTHTEFDLPSRFYNVSSNTRESGEPVGNAGPFSEPINFSWAQALIKKFKALVFLTTETEQNFYVKPKIFAFYKRESGIPVKDIDKYINVEQYFGNVIPSLKISRFNNKPRLSMTSRIYVVNALSKLLYLMIDESEYYKHYEIFAKNITSLVELYKAYQEKSINCNGIKIVVEQTPSTHSVTAENQNSQYGSSNELSKQLKLILESLEGNKAANAQMIYELIAALKLSELPENEGTNDNVGAAEEEREEREAAAAAAEREEEAKREAAATKIQATFRGFNFRKAEAKRKAEEAAERQAAAEAAAKREAAAEAARVAAEAERQAAARRSQEEEAEREAAERAEAARVAAERAAEAAEAKRIATEQAAAEAAEREAARRRQEEEREAARRRQEEERAAARAAAEAKAEAPGTILTDFVKDKICRYYKEIYKNCSNLNSKPVYINKGTGRKIFLSSLTFGALCDTDCSAKQGINRFTNVDTGVEVGEEGLIFKLINHGNDVEIDVDAMNVKFVSLRLPSKNKVLKYEIVGRDSKYVQKKKLLKNEAGELQLFDIE